MKSKEIFKDIPGYEGYYQVSNLGRVKSLERTLWNGKVFHKHKGIFLKQLLSSNKYMCVNLYKFGKVKRISVHVLVSIAFLNHKQNGFNGLIVDHINNIKTDNKVENLQLITPRENLSKDRVKKYGTLTGAFYDKSRGTWRSDIRINGKLKYLGIFKTELEASKAYQKELKKIKNGI